MNIFERILEIRSLTAIGWKAEEELATVQHTAEEGKALVAIMGTNKLDEAWAICHEQLGNVAEAKKLRDWLARDKPKVDLSILDLV